MSDQNVEFVKSVYGAFGRGDVPAVLGAFAEDIEWFEAEGMPYGGLHHGPEAVAQKVFGPITEDVDGFALVTDDASNSRVPTVPVDGVARVVTPASCWFTSVVRYAAARKLNAIVRPAARADQASAASGRSISFSAATRTFS